MSQELHTPVTSYCRWKPAQWLGNSHRRIIVEALTLQGKPLRSSLTTLPCHGDGLVLTWWVPTVSGRPSELRGSWEDFGGRARVLCPEHTPGLGCAAVAICIGPCYLWLCIFAQKEPSHLLRQLPTQDWLPLGFSRGPPGCHVTSEHLSCDRRGSPSLPISCGFTSARSFM